MQNQNQQGQPDQIEIYSPGKSLYAAVEPPIIVTAAGALIAHFLPDVDKTVIYSGVALLYGFLCGLRNWLKNRNKGKA